MNNQHTQKGGVMNDTPTQSNIGKRKSADTRDRYKSATIKKLINPIIQ